jgi:hypothetical protein
MKKITSLFLLFVFALSLTFVFGSCTNNKANSQKPKTPEEAHDILYNWLVDNGELKNGTTICYSYHDFTITANAAQEINLSYSKGWIDGYNTSYSLPLLSNEEETTLEITLKKSEDTYVFGCIHSPETFRMNIPLSYEEISGPNYKEIRINDYCSVRYENGKYIYTPYPDKADEYYALKDYNKKIKENTEKAKEAAIGYSHTALAEILVWLESDICKSTGLTLSELGYKSYKK